MIKFPAVDVVILCVDYVDDTIDAIKSVLAQRGVRQRVIVVDQGSAPRSLDALRSFCAQHEQVTLLCNRENIGRSAGRNQAAELGDAEFILMLDAGAEFIDCNQLARGCAIMKARHQLGVVAFRIVQKERGEDEVAAWIYPQPMENWSRQRFATDRFSSLGHMLRRSVFTGLGGYDPVLFGIHDEVDFAKRVINHGFTIEYAPRVAIAWSSLGLEQSFTETERWQFDVRNRTYMHLKFRSGLKAFIRHVLQIFGYGYRARRVWPTCVGLLRGCLLAPRAIYVRRHEPATFTTEQARTYIQSCKRLTAVDVHGNRQLENSVRFVDNASAEQTTKAVVAFQVEGQEIRRA